MDQNERDDRLQDNGRVFFGPLFSFVRDSRLRGIGTIAYHPMTAWLLVHASIRSFVPWLVVCTKTYNLKTPLCYGCMY
jgi:hypothetical protein